MLATKLSPKEKRRVERGIRNIQILSRRKSLSEVERFIKRQQLRAILLILGADRRRIGYTLKRGALDIILDWKPFKIRRLRKLINGRRACQ